MRFISAVWILSTLVVLGTVNHFSHNCLAWCLDPLICKASSSRLSRYFTFIWGVEPQLEPSICRKQVQTSMSAEWPSRNVPTTFVRCRISRFICSMAFCCGLSSSVLVESACKSASLECLVRLYSTPLSFIPAVSDHSLCFLQSLRLVLLGVDHLEYSCRQLDLGAQHHEKKLREKYTMQR